MAEQMYYKDRPLEELSKEELIDALKESFHSYCRLQGSLEKALDLLAPYKNVIARGVLQTKV